MSKCSPVIIRKSQEVVTSLFADSNFDSQFNQDHMERILKRVYKLYYMHLIWQKNNCVSFLQACMENYISDPDLIWLVNVVDLLSVCAENKCQSGINLCQRLLPIEVLLR